MGHARCANMPAVSKRERRRYRQPVLHHHARMVRRSLRPCIQVLKMTRRKWPNPVLLKPIEDGPLQVRVWNPKVSH